MEKRLWGWKREVLRAHGLIAGLFARSELRARSLGYVQGLLSKPTRAPIPVPRCGSQAFTQ